MKKIAESFAVAFSMYSKIPMPHVTWTKQNMRYALCFFPLVGAVIGVLEYLWNLLSVSAGSGRLFFAAVAVAIPFFVTGGIHFDGFLDTADAMSSWRERDERLRILKDPHVGAFAVIAAGVYLILALGTASEVQSRELLCLCLAFMLSRSFSGLSVVSFRKAKSDGTAAAFSRNAGARTVRAVMILYIGILSAAEIVFDPFSGVLVLAGAVISFFIYHHLAYRYFGGMTGDLAGFYVSFSELLMVLFPVIGRGIAGILI